jgi:glycosyltransferase involved in cell wall biosynthesis
MNEFVSVVVPTWNRATYLEHAVASLVAQDYPDDSYEIVVVDDGSTDATLAVVQEYVGSNCAVRVRAVHQLHAGLNVARNAGIASARGDLICLVDDDVEAPSGWLRAVVRGAARYPTAGCLGGPIRMRFEGRQPRLCGREGLGDSELDLGPADRLGQFLFGANLAVRRSAVEQIGLFREDIPTGGDDEIEWERRLLASGGATAYVADAWLWHRRTAADLRLRRLMRKMFVRGQRRVEHARIVGEPVSIGVALGGIPRALAHTVVRRCEYGILNISRRLGMAWACLRSADK